MLDYLLFTSNPECRYMTFYRALRTFFFLMLPLGLNATVYLEKPEDFQPKAEIVGCFLEYDDMILLLHRQDHCVQGNCWGVPGGKIHKSETPLQAAVRETFEETGFDISKLRIIDLGKVYIKYPKHDEIYYMFKCQPTEQPGSVKISFDEHKGFTWVAPADALKMHLMLEEDVCIKMVYP
jgi:8-oxo-dGTP pyrophosphatase MutT (NUDIX family)